MRSLLMILMLSPALLSFASETPAPGQAPRAPQPSPRMVSSETQLFQVALLRASRKGTDDTEGLPKSATKALADIREFLPFKRYQFLDSALVRLALGMQSTVRVDAYEVKFSYELQDDKLSIWRFTVLPARKLETPAPPPGPSRGPARAPEAVKPLISTTFVMDRGETVVVGSSKLEGDEALVVLLTALPRR